MDTPRSPLSLLCGSALALSALAFASLSAHCRAEDPFTPHRALPSEALLYVRIDGFPTLEQQPLVQAVLDKLMSSQELERAANAVNVSQLRDGLLFVATRMGMTPRELIRQVTAGGIDAAAKVDESPDWLIVFSTAGETVPDRLLTVLRQIAGPENVREGTHRGVTGYAIGNAAVAAFDSYLLVASRADELKKAVDRLLDRPETNSPAQDARPNHSWEIAARVDLSQFRRLPDVERALQIPGEDAGLIAFFGRWIDIVRRHDALRLQLRFDDEGFLTRMDFTGPNATADVSLSETDDAARTPGPLLRVPNAIYSTSWSRDLAHLWDHREDLLTDATRERLEKQDRESAAQFEALGASLGLSDIARLLGTRFRIVVAENLSPPYDIEITDMLPAAAVAIELRSEEEFDRTLRPLLQAVGLIVTFEQGLVTEESEYAGARLTTFTLPTTDEALLRRSRGDYNFRTTYAITRGHLVIGTTPGIVHGVIDALGNSTEEAEQRDRGRATSYHWISGRGLQSALESLHAAIVRNSVLQRGLDITEAEHEFNVVHQLIGLFEQGEVTGQYKPDGYEYVLRLNQSKHVRAIPD